MQNSSNCYIGLTFALSSSLFIGSSFIIKKKALTKLRANGSLRAGSGGLGYLREWSWWLGFFCLTFGEILNVTAYPFAPASLIAPLGVLSVLVTSILASYYLHERLNLLGKFGCLLCVFGSTIMVIHSPKEENIDTLEEVVLMLQKPLFVFYCFIVVLLLIYINIFIVPRHGNKNITVYICLCSCIGSLNVMFCKALGIAFKEMYISNKNISLLNPLILFFLSIVIVSASLQMNYLNRALDIFNTSLVTPIYYVMFTTLVIIASTILFEDWIKLTILDIVGNLCGFLTIIIGIILLNTFKDIDISLSNVKHVFRPKNELLLPQFDERSENEFMT